jgi:4-hydroxy-tetrahydrodipicolinate synthase
LKDTSCDPAVMRRREAIRSAFDKEFGLYNANCATLFDSLHFGYDGFSGVMANFHPELYVWMYEHRDDPRADTLDKYLGMLSVIEARCYPVCAKRYLAKYEGLPITDVCRSAKDTNVPAVAYELRAVSELTREAKNIIANY